MNETFIVVRIALYFWVVLEALLLAYLYHFGYDNLKKTSIIQALVNFFVCLGTYFLFVTSVAVALLFDIKTRETMLCFVSIPLIGLIISLRRFRHWTLNQKGQNGKNKNI